MKRTWTDPVGEWARNRLRNKAKKPQPTVCTCPASGLSTICPIRLHRERAKLVQGLRHRPRHKQIRNKQYVLEHPESPK